MEACHRYFQERSIEILNDWLEACIQWVIAENNNEAPAPNQLVDLVYEQWLMADLQDIAQPILPKNLSKQGCKTINGKFNLQVTNIVDIGHSAYSQLSKIKGEEIDELDDQEDDDLKEFFNKGAPSGKNNTKGGTPKWKENSCRMLLLEMSDGFQTIEGIEYNPIQQLSVDNIMPGGKVLLSGPLVFRNGIVLLKPENVKVLGGNIEQLVESSSQIKVLSNILQVSADEIENKAKNNQRQLVQRQQAQRQQAQRNQARTNQGQINQSQKAEASKCTTQINKQPNVTHELSNDVQNATNHQYKPSAPQVDLINDDLMNDDFFEGVQMDDWNDDIHLTDNKSQKQPIQTNDNNLMRNKNSIQNNKKFQLSRNTNTVSDNQIISTDVHDDFFNDDFVLEPFENDTLFDNNKNKSNLKPVEHKTACASRVKQPNLKENPKINEQIRTLKPIENKTMFASKVKQSYLQEDQRNDQACDTVDDFADAKNYVNGMKEVNKEEQLMEADIDNFFSDDGNDLVDCKPAPLLLSSTEKSLKDMITENPPLSRKFTIKGWFKTLSSRLHFENNTYKLHAVLTDGVFYVQVLLANQVLNDLVGYTAKQVNDAVAGLYDKSMKNKIKMEKGTSQDVDVKNQALHNAEQCLQHNKWVLQLCYNSIENIYEIIDMKKNDRTA